MKHHIIFSLILSIYSTTTIVAQTTSNNIPVDTTLKKQIKIVSEYEPSVSDAFKINSLPQAIDTTSIRPSFRYSIVSNPIETEYTVTPISAARMKGEPLSKLYKSQVTVGLGNYLTTHANVKLNSLRSSKYQYGIDLYHFGSFSDITLADDSEAPAGYTNNYAHAFGKKFFDKTSLYGDFRIQRNGFHYYGYDIAQLAKKTPRDTSLSADNTFQRYLYITATGGFKSHILDSTKLHHKTEIGYQFVNEVNGIGEHGFSTNVEFQKYIEDKSISIEATNNFYQKTGGNNDSISGNLFTITPWFAMQSGQWKIKAGISVSSLMGTYENTTVYPRIAFDFDIIDNMLIPYFIYGGQQEYNSVFKISQENKYILDSLNVAPTYYNNLFTGGFKGLISKNIPFNIYCSFTDAENMYFYVNDAVNTDSVQNKFSVIYDDISILNLHAQIGFVKQEKISINLLTNYYSYNLKKEAHAWHKPEFTISLNSKYNMQNKFIFTLDVFYIGERYAKSNQPTIENYKLSGFVDANLGIEYRYTKILSAFLNINNIAAQKYQQWNFYPNYRFNILFGVSYAL